MADSEYTRPPEANSRKRLIVCCDGTGQSSSNGEGSVPTNVTRFARALNTSDLIPANPGDSDNGVPAELAVEIPQVVLYQTGIGTEGITEISDTLASAVGFGLDRHVLEAYTFFSSNYEASDELFLFGFSRGAFTARALASLICNAGLLRKDRLEYLPMIYDEYKKRRDTKAKRDEFNKWVEERKQEFGMHNEVVIKILGVWDTVGSLGVPQTSVSNTLNAFGVRPNWNESYGYHDTSFPMPESRDHWKGFISKAYQALALDECRASFSPTLLYLPNKLEGPNVGHATEFLQCWFPGAHSDVGGGYERAYHDISDITFAWMVDLCRGYLSFRPGLEESLKRMSLEAKDPLAPPLTRKDLPQDLGWGLSKEHDEYHTVTFIAGGKDDRTPGQYFLDKRYDEAGEKYITNEYMHPVVRLRMMKKEGGWKPPALAGFVLKKDGEGWYWEKKAEVKGKKYETVVIREWVMNLSEDTDPTTDLSASLLTPEARKSLNDEKASLAIPMVKVLGPVSSILL